MAVSEEEGCCPSDDYRILRAGGLGPMVRALESRLDASEDVRLSLAEIRQLADDPNEKLDLLWCTNRFCSLGILDATAMFLQCVDKQAESRVTAQFREVDELTDRQFG
jgi:hypothetical protein